MGIKLADIARHLDGELIGDPEVPISGVAPFGNAGTGELTYAGSKAFLNRIDSCEADAVIGRHGL